MTQVHFLTHKLYNEEAIWNIHQLAELTGSFLPCPQGSIPTWMMDWSLVPALVTQACSLPQMVAVNWRALGVEELAQDGDDLQWASTNTANEH